MRPTLASSPPSEPRSAGFTLLELLWVLVLVGLLSAWVAPAAWRWIEGARQRSALADLRAEIESLPVRTFLSGQPRALGEDAPFATVLPSGWRIATDSPLRYEANGMTAGGRIRVYEEGTLRADWRILAPDGVVVPMDRK